MKRFLALAVVMMMFVLTGCRHDGPEDKQCRRAVLVYIEARNSLNPWAPEDLAEMARATVPADCRLLVYRSGFSEAPALLEMKQGKLVELRRYAEGSAAVSPGHMRRVLDDVSKLAPARERGLVLWSHGWGWMQTITNGGKSSRAFGHENYRDAMSNSQIAEALDGAGLDFLLFDSCFMASVEVAYELRRCARYLVASAAETPGAGMPYDVIVPLLFEEDLEEGLRHTVDAVADYYDAHKPDGGCPVTMSLTDLPAIDELAAETRRILAQGRELPSGFTPQRFATSSRYRDLFFDLEEYMEAMGADEQWRRALGRAVLASRHSPMIWNSLPLVYCCGLTSYIPLGGNGYSLYGYNTLAWYKDVVSTSSMHN